MNKNFIVKKCASCGAIIKLLSEHDDSSIKCCDKEMETLIPNSTSAVVEKHVPTYTVDGNFISANVAHVMEEEHFIEWMCLVTGDKE